MSFWGKKADSTPPSGISTEVLTEQDVQKAVTPTPTVSPAISTSTPSRSDEEKYGKIRSALGPGTIIQGKLSFDSAVSIDGKLNGEIFSSKTLLVGASGVVDAQVDVATLIIKGIVKGVVRATERVEVRSGGQLLGDVITPCLVIDEGCIFSGNCSMKAAVDAQSKQKPPTKIIQAEDLVKADKGATESEEANSESVSAGLH